MRTVPRNIDEQLSFFKVHVAKWAEDPAGIGTTAEIVAQLAALVGEAEADDQAKRAAEQTARSATLRARLSRDAMNNLGASIISQIRAKARVDGNEIYSLGSIPAPQQGSPVAPPGTPSGFKATLDGIGSLTLTWACKNPRGSVGTQYMVWRQLEFRGPFEFLGNVGEKRFVDATLPAGSARVVYRVQAMRSTATGDCADFPVNLAGPGKQFAPMHQRQRNAA